MYGISISLARNKKLTVISLLDRQPDEQDHEDLNDIVGEVIADIDIMNVVFTVVKKLGRLMKYDLWVFLRIIIRNVY